MTTMKFIAGPCVIESAELLDAVAERLVAINRALGTQIIFKASFDKANRTSITSFRGPGLDRGLQMLADVRAKWGLRLLTDIHESWQAAPVGEVVDVIQIPAFLCRQTDLLVAAAKTGRTVNIKKAQFLSGADMRYPYEKAREAGAAEVWLTERGNMYGYNNLVVDFRNIPDMLRIAQTVVMDCTHSVQRPGAAGGKTGGNREFVPAMALAARAFGANAFFFEVHPDPDRALSDGPNMLRLDDLENLIKTLTIMTETSKAQILAVARKAMHTEMLALKHLEETLGDNFVAAVELILACRGKCIVTGMGKSGLVGRKIAATLASTGTPSFFLHPGEAFHGDLGMISKEDVVLALSYSGETDEILKIVPFIHSNGNKLISMTGHAESALAKNSDVHLDVAVREEACILHLAPTTSTTAQIAMGDALAVSLMQLRGFTSVDFARLHPGGSLGRRLLMTVGNVMRSHDLPVVAPDCSATDMIHAISKGGLGLIVICEGDRIEGIVTDGDVRRAMERRRAEFFNIKAADIATPHPKTIAASAKLIEAEKMMTKNKVTSLLVTDEAGKLAGVVQIYDIKL